MSTERIPFLNESAAFLAGMLCLTLFLAVIAGLSPLSAVHLSFTDTAIGAGAAVLMVFLFSFVTSVRDLAERILGPSLAKCYWYDLLILAILVGIVEEMLFRGVLEPWAARINPTFAFIAVNILFGLLHSVSVNYAIVAMILGGILSGLAHAPGDFNLLRPIVAHAVYDFIGFVWLAERSRRSIVTSPPPGS